MIRKLLLTMILVISGIIMANSQCTPNMLCAALICPDTIINLPHAQASIAYSTTVTVIVPADTNIAPFGTVTIDTIKCTSVTGLPAGITAVPDELAGWPGGSAGCLLISGSTTTPGIYPLVINTSIKVLLGTTPLTLPIPLNGYKIVVDSAMSTITFDKNRFSLYQNSPNPFLYKTTIEFSSPLADVYNFTVCDVIGNVVYRQTINANAGLNKIEFMTGSLTSGIYMYKLSNNKESYTKRMIVAGR